MTVFGFLKTNLLLLSQKKSDTNCHEFVLSSTFMERSAKSLRFLLKQVKVTFLNVAYVMTLFNKKGIIFYRLSGKHHRVLIFVSIGTCSLVS